MEPGIEVVTLNAAELDVMVRKTQVVINTVGPYCLYSSPVVEACAKNGTHYLDVTGESPWVLDMIREYHDVAKANHAILIPCIGIESAPSDLLAFALTTLIRKKLSLGTKEVIGCVYAAAGMPSGGTLATILGVIEHYGWKDIARSAGTWASCPIPSPRNKSSPPLLSRVFGFRSVPGLGTLTSSISAGPNMATVQRSWGLLDSGNLYGDKFSYQEYAAVRNAATGVAIHFAMLAGALALVFPPFRWLMRKFVYAPGEGATRDATRKDFIEFRAVATPDEEGPNPRHASGKLRWDGGNYFFTGVCLAEAAMVLLKEHDLVKQLEGGLLTPAMIAEPFIQRMVNSGMIFEVAILES